MSQINFEDKVLKQVDIYTKVIREILPDDNYTFNINDNPNYKIIDVFDKNKKKILSVQCQLLGSYDPDTKIFNWGCNKKISDKKNTELSKLVKSKAKKIKKYILTKKYNDLLYLETLYYYLTNSIFFINDLTKLIKYSIYVTKSKGILFYTNDHNDNIKIQNCYIIIDIISF